jgi:hypothetical protein
MVHIYDLQLKTRQGEHSKNEYTHAHWENHALILKLQNRRTAVSSLTAFNTDDDHICKNM